MCADLEFADGSADGDCPCRQTASGRWIRAGSSIVVVLGDDGAAGSDAVQREGEYSDEALEDGELGRRFAGRRGGGIRRGGARGRPFGGWGRRGPPRRPRRPRHPWPRRTRWPLPLRTLVLDRPATDEDEGSEYVRWVQTTLNQILDEQLAVDGVMNPETRRALRAFQRRQGLPPDGIVGPETKRALIAARSGVRGNRR